MSKFACGYVLTFADGGEPEETVLCIGTLESCEAVRRLCPAVAYSGSRPNPKAQFVVVEVPE